MSVHIAETEELARAKKARLDDLVITSHGIGQIRAVTGLDLSAHGMDERLDSARILSENGATQMSRADEILAIIDEADCTLRELVTHIAGARAHRVLVGTADSVADSLEEWFVSGACDGFNLLPPSLPGGLDDIVHHLLPELRRRKVWWPAEGGTLRQRFGARPVRLIDRGNRHHIASVVARRFERRQEGRRLESPLRVEGGSLVVEHGHGERLQQPTQITLVEANHLKHDRNAAEGCESGHRLLQHRRLHPLDV